MSIRVIIVYYVYMKTRQQSSGTAKLNKSTILGALSVLVLISIVGVFTYQALKPKLNHEDAINEALFVAQQYITSIKTCDTELYKKTTGQELSSHFPNCDRQRDYNSSIYIDTTKAEYNTVQDANTHKVTEVVSTVTKSVGGPQIGYGQMITIMREKGSSQWQVLAGY